MYLGILWNVPTKTHRALKKEKCFCCFVTLCLVSIQPLGGFSSMNGLFKVPESPLNSGLWVIKGGLASVLQIIVLMQNPGAVELKVMERWLAVLQDQNSLQNRPGPEAAKATPHYHTTTTMFDRRYDVFLLSCCVSFRQSITVIGPDKLIYPNTNTQGILSTHKSNIPQKVNSSEINRTHVNKAIEITFQTDGCQCHQLFGSGHEVWIITVYS